MFIFEFAALAIALVGSSIAAWEDLRTTEIPDKIPHLMIASGLAINAAQTMLLQDYWPLLESAAVGLSFLGFGFLMYRFGQWGGGDAKVLAAVGFLLPGFSSLPSGVQLLFPFPLSFVVNVFFIGAVYMLAYAAVVAARNRKIIGEFASSVRASSRTMACAAVALALVFMVLCWQMSDMLGLRLDPAFVAFNTLLPLASTIGLFLVWKFAKAVENVGFRRRVSVRMLRAGDVLLESKVFEGLTANEVRKIKKSGRKYVVVKEGVRFAPAFPLGLLFTVFFGDAIFLLLRLLA